MDSNLLRKTNGLIWSTPQLRSITKIHLPGNFLNYSLKRKPASDRELMKERESVYFEFQALQEGQKVEFFRNCGGCTNSNALAKSVTEENS